MFLWVNDAFTNIDGLSNITSVGQDITIDDLPLLTDINGLSSVTSVGDDLNITDNAALTGFCGINPLLINNGLTGSYNVTGNAVNPTVEEIILAGPCEYSDPAELKMNCLLMKEIRMRLHQNYS